MEIYVEYVILDNFSVDLLLLILTGRIMHFRLQKWRLMLAGALGTAFAFVSPYLKLSGTLLFLIKSAMGIAVYAVGCAQRKRNLYGLIIFFAATFLFGGICLGVFNMFHISFHEGAAMQYSGMPIGFLIVPILAAWWAVERLCRYIHKKKDLATFVRTVRITYRGRKCELQAFIDSGNRLYHREDPVCVIDYRGASMLLGGELIGLLAKKENNSVTLQNFQGTKSKLLSFYADKLDILDKDGAKSWTRVCFAVVMKEFQDAEAYDVLLSPAFV